MGGEWDAAAARDAVARLPAYRDEATTRVAGLTWMVWGLAFGAAILAAGATVAADEVVPDLLGLPFLVLSYLAPLTLAAFVTHRIWQSAAVLPNDGPAAQLLGYALLAPLLGVVALVLLALAALLGSVALEVAGVPVPDWNLRGQAGLGAAALWAALFAMTGWSVASIARGRAILLSGTLLLLAVPLGALASGSDAAFHAANSLGAVAVMIGFVLLGTFLYGRG